MSRFLLVFVLLLLLAVPGRAADSDEAQLRELKTVLWPRAYREQDTALLERILDDAFQSIDASGVRSDKAGELAWIKAHKPGYDHFEYEIERLEIHGGDSAIVSGLGRIHKAGEPLTRYRSTNVLVKRDGTWRALASHVSMLGPEEE